VIRGSSPPTSAARGAASGNSLKIPEDASPIDGIDALKLVLGITRIIVTNAKRKYLVFISNISHY
jgi:hypothetical protein